MRFQQLMQDSSDSLCRLFEKESGARYSILWQDRSPQFFSLYPERTLDKIHAFGLMEQDELVASSLLTWVRSFSLGSGDADWELWYDTDCFVDPQYRNKGWSFDLIKKRNDFLINGSFKKNSADSKRRLFFGIENQPGFLHSISQNPRAYQAHFIYGPKTILHDVYPDKKDLSEFRSKNSLSLSQSRIEKHKLKEFNDFSFVSNFESHILSQNHGSPRFKLFPSFDRKTCRHLSMIDPDSELWLYSENGIPVAGWTLANFEKVRRFCFNPSGINLNLSQHPLGHLSLGESEPLRSLIVGQFWINDSQSHCLIPLLEEVAAKCFREGFHNFYLRDFNQVLLEESFKNVFHFPRKLLFWMLDPDLEDLNFLRQVEKMEMTFWLDNHFL